MKLDDLINEISEKMQNLEDVLRGEENEDIKIGFPAGVLRTAKQIRERLIFTEDETLRRNLAYHLMLCDFYGWFLNRFRVILTAQDMIIKECLVLYGNIIAAIVKDISGRKGFKTSVKMIVEKGIVTEDMGKNLIWLWGIRNKGSHIESLNDWEYQKYYMSDYQKGIAVWNELESCLRTAKNKEMF